MERIFQPFFTTRAGHAGLGLVLAEKVLALHGGEIRADNLAPGGFRITAGFPLNGPHDEQGSVPGVS